MKLALRLVLLVIIVPPISFFFASLFSMLLVLTGLHLSAFALPIVELFGVIASIPVVVFVLKARVDDTATGRRTAVRMGALVLGCGGFIVGIVGAEIYWPESDLNILMGPIIGSLGFILGALGGLFYWLYRKNNMQ